MIFRRKIYDQLIDWKCKQNGKTALLIEGARRIGKKTAVMQFAEKEYRSNLVIDFSKASDEVKGYFLSSNGCPGQMKAAMGDPGRFTRSFSKVMRS